MSVVDAPGGEFDNYRVQKFDANGTFLRQWGAFGANTAQSIEIAGITTDPANNVWPVCLPFLPMAQKWPRSSVSRAGPIFTSADSGLSWQSYRLPQATWSAIVSSADGARLFASGDQNIFSLQTTPAPQLETRLAGSQVLLSWIIPSAPFLLQQASGLSTPQWTNSANSPALNLHYQIAVPAAGPSAFYRLSAQ